MDAVQLLLFSISLYFIAACATVLLIKYDRWARWSACLFGSIASLVGIFSAAIALTSIKTPATTLFEIPTFGSLVLTMDHLSAFLVGLITLIGLATSIYSVNSKSNNGFIGFFTGIFLAAMLLVVTVSNSFYFLLFWEVMTLSTYFLVIWETDKKESIRAGYIYMLVAHAGAVLIMLVFLIFFQSTGSFDFNSFRKADISPNLRNLMFLLAFIGFGAKAAMVPLHFWAPGAYKAAPTHISALMSSVMKKTAVYGILRVCVDLLGLPLWWWGFIILAFGVLSAVIGALYALTESDLKRLLAYSSIENVGIILMGIGVGVMGLAIQLPVLASLGFLAALYHSLNHAFFKSLLFLGTGSVTDQLGTANLNYMGGIAKKMPWTALTFLIGAISVSAIPPFSGFASEWFTYQAFFSASQTPLLALRVFAPLFAILLALAGAIAIMVYIKAFGGAFTGPARNQVTESLVEAPWGMLSSKIYLAIGCIVLGLGAPFIAPIIANVAANFIKLRPITVSSGWFLYPADPQQAVMSTPFIAIFLLGFITIPLLLVTVFGGWRAGRRSGVDPWACGYGYSYRMSVSASSFDQPVKDTFQPIYWLRTLADKPFMALTRFGQSSVHQIQRAEPVVEIIVTRPTIYLVEKIGQWIQTLQMGDIRLYCFYIILTLAILLLAIFGRSGL